jgi:hypothetical protein
MGPSPGYLLAPINPNALPIIWREVNGILADPQGVDRYGANLAGNLNGEYALTQSKQTIAWALEDLVSEYIQTFNYKVNVNYPQATEPVLELDDLWVNFQYPGEYNPPHKHSGVLSFALWLQVPYTLEQEAAQAPTSNYPNKPPTGDFEFQWTDSLGRIQYTNMYVDKSKENYVCIFPSQMSHSVSPYFTKTTTPRISVSGNFKYKF